MQYSHCTCAPGNPVLKSIKAGKERGSWTFHHRGLSSRCPAVPRTHQRSRKTRGRTGAQRDSTRMNFAAQLFYSSYLSERLERLYSPRPAIKDCEENDPFWQRWENATIPAVSQFSSHRWQFVPILLLNHPLSLWEEPQTCCLCSSLPGAPSCCGRHLPSEKCANPKMFITSSIW